jgi:hypothetical protein
VLLAPHVIRAKIRGQFGIAAAFRATSVPLVSHESTVPFGPLDCSFRGQGWSWGHLSCCRRSNAWYISSFLIIKRRNDTSSWHQTNGKAESASTSRCGSMNRGSWTARTAFTSSV